MLLYFSDLDSSLGLNIASPRLWTSIEFQLDSVEKSHLMLGRKLLIVLSLSTPWKLNHEH